MPLCDHFYAPWSEQNPWEGFHSAWVNTIVRHLNGSLLPAHYRAMPQVHLGPMIEADIAAYEAKLASLEDGESVDEGADGNGRQLWSPP